MTITTEQLRVGLGLTRNEWRELQYAAVDREVTTRELIRSLIRSLICTMLVWCEVRRAEPESIRQSQSTRSQYHHAVPRRRSCGRRTERTTHACRSTAAGTIARVSRKA